MTIAAAIWLVMSETIGFATGGYLAGRLRSPAYDGVIGETRFRDAAQGLTVWALGVVLMTAIAIGTGFVAIGATSHVAAGAAAGISAAPPARDSAGAASATTDYFVDLLFRPRSGGEAARAGAAGDRPALSTEARAEVIRVIARGISQGGLEDADRTYLAQLVAARTGLPPDEAQRRVTDVETRARLAVKEAADKAAKAGSFFSFWLFMPLLFGGVAATLAGMLGGDLRDAETRRATR